MTISSSPLSQEVACGRGEQGQQPESGGSMKFVEEGGGRGGSVASSEDTLEAAIHLESSHNKSSAPE